MNVMENRKNKIISGLVLIGLVVVSHKSFAGLGNKLEQYIGDTSAYANGFYIIMAVIGVGVIGKICQHLFMTEEEQPVSKVRVSHHRHHRTRIIKKTS